MRFRIHVKQGGSDWWEEHEAEEVTNEVQAEIWAKSQINVGNYQAWWGNVPRAISPRILLGVELLDVHKAADPEETRLYHVEVVAEVMVLACDRAEAERVARMNLREEDYDNFDAFACETDEAGDIPEKWQDSIPYGEERDRSCAQIMADQLCRAQAREHERKLKEAEAAHPTLGLEEK